MSVSANTAASALATTWVHLFAALPNGWVRRESGVVAAMCGVAMPNANGVLPEQVDLDRLLVAELLDEVANSGLPHCLQLRPGAPEELVDLAADRGMIKEDQIPLMVLESSGRLEAHRKVEGLVIRQLSPEEAALHAETAARGFEVPKELFVQFMTPSVLRLPGVRCYVGEIDGEAVTTGIGVTLGPFVAIFNIATPPEHRGQGFGAAVTARAASDGFADGAQWSYLQSSLAGYSTYTRLGYATLERWDCWVAVS
jgi:ribosomal protein S18 acetylase RimI-like enzyme